MEMCTSCGQPALRWEDAECQKVCTACGIVVQEGCFTADQPHNSEFAPNVISKEFKQYSQNLPSVYGAANDSELPPCKGFLECMKILDDLATCLLLPPERKKSAQETFKTVFYQPKFKTHLVSSKIVMAGVCIYIICRQNNVPITVSQMCQFIGCKVADFVRWKREIVSTFSIEIPSICLEDLVSSQCKGYGFNDTVISLTEQIVQVCRSVWLVEGRKPQHLISAAAYLAWKSEDWATRMKVTLSEFCKRHRVVDTKVISTRVFEMTNVMISLARELPWVSPASVNKKSVIIYIQDIVKFKNSLLTSALSTIKEKEISESQGHTSEVLPDDTVSCAKSLNSSNESILPSQETTLLKGSGHSTIAIVKNETDNKPDRESQEIVTHKRSAKELGELHNFVSQPPISSLKRKKTDTPNTEIRDKEIKHDLDCPELGPDDMSECELKFYV